HRQGDRVAPAAAVQEFLAGVLPRFAPSRGAGLAFLAEQSSSPTRRRLVQALRERLPEAIWAEYEPVDQTAPERAATRLAGRPSRPHYEFSRAQRILAVDADFIGTEEDHLRYARDFAAGRRLAKADDPMNRLYA